MAAISSSTLTLGVLYLAADTVTGSSDTAALYAMVTAIGVALIGGGTAIYMSRRTPVTRLPTDEPTTHALPREMADLLVEVIAERDQYKRELDRCRRQHSGIA